MLRDVATIVGHVRYRAATSSAARSRQTRSRSAVDDVALLHRTSRDSPWFGAGDPRAVGRLSERPAVFVAALGAALGMTSAAVSVRAPQHAAGNPAHIELTGELAPHSARITDRVFDVPYGTAQIDLDLDGLDSDAGDPLDFGLRGPGGIRGWSTARHPHIHLDAMSASYGYLPGPIEPGRWQVMLGPHSDDSQPVRPYRITIRLSSTIEASRTALPRGAGWFAGDLHMHSAHSDGYRDDRTGRRPLPVTVRELAQSAVDEGLDFAAVTDHNTSSQWIDVDREQGAYPDLLLLHGREISTPRGHFNAIGERRVIDFRIGPERPMARLLSEISAGGAFVSANHPWLTSDAWCGGCGWADHDPATTSAIQGVEILNGSTPTPPGELPGWHWWAQLLNAGRRVTAVGGSDSHDPQHTRGSIGTPTTVVWASGLSETALVAGLRSGRVFVRGTPNHRLFIEISADDGIRTIDMGQTARPGRLRLTARVRGAAGETFTWIRRGQAIDSTRVTTDDATASLSVTAEHGDWFSAVAGDPAAPILFSNAIYVSAGGGVVP